jgi:multidrug efflux pump subunit AcrB
VTNVVTAEDRARRSGQQHTRGRRRGMLFSAETEARPAIMTTEYWLTLLAAATVVIAGYVSDVFDENVAWALFGGIVAAYVLSRGIAKAGSKEGPFSVRRSDWEQ